MANRFARRALATAAVLLLFADRGNADLARAGGEALCPRAGDSVTVIARKRELWLCHEGAPRGPFSVALGRGGLDKHRAGDARTPLGTYPLGTPRPSEEFGTFIPIGYPTPQQVAEGYTGSAIGIHGPPRGPFALERWTTAIDWTLGCIATGDDHDVLAIADFVRERLPSIVIR